MMHFVVLLLDLGLLLGLVQGETHRIVDPNQAREEFRPHIGNMRHFPYCEILSSRNKFGIFHLLEFTAYNTFLFGCDVEKWNEITQDYIRKHDSSSIVVLNGPRRWAFDTLAVGSTFVDRSVTMFNDLKWVVVGIVQATLYDMVVHFLYPSAKFYSERMVNRATTYVFRAGLPIHYLRAPTGKTYVMQSYSVQIFNVTQSVLPVLDQHLSLPAGWTYHVRTLSNNLFLKAINDVGVIVTDNFMSVYSYCDPVLIEEAAGDNKAPIGAAAAIEQNTEL